MKLGVTLHFGNQSKLRMKRKGDETRSFHVVNTTRLPRATYLLTVNISDLFIREQLPICANKCFLRPTNRIQACP